MNLNKIKLPTYFFIAVFVFILIGLLIVLLRSEKDLTFPSTMVINLDSRADRIKEINSEFAGWPVKVERISAVKMSPGWKGCSASHLKSLRIAKERAYPWVVILEDDCILTPGARHQFELLLPYLWTKRSQWDIFYGGTTFLKDISVISKAPAIYKVKGFTTHFCLIHADTYDKILNGHPSEVSEYKEPIDVFYAENFRIWTTTPFFAKQRPGASDIGENKIEDYSDVFATAEETLLKL